MRTKVGCESCEKQALPAAETLDAFNEQRAAMPWLAIPFSHARRRAGIAPRRGRKCAIERADTISDLTFANSGGVTISSVAFREAEDAFDPDLPFGVPFVEAAGGGLGRSPRTADGASIATALAGSHAPSGSAPSIRTSRPRFGAMVTPAAGTRSAPADAGAPAASLAKTYASTAGTPPSRRKCSA